MDASEVAGFPVTPLRAGTPTARADSTVRHSTAGIDGEQVIAFVHSDRAHVDNVEHERQNRLKRWQAPPNPTRKVLR